MCLNLGVTILASTLEIQIVLYSQCTVGEAKIFTRIVKHIYISVYFLQENFDNGPFVKIMRSLVYCRQICAPDHVQVQISVVVLNGWMGSDYIQTVIHNTIKSWNFISFLWTKLTM